MNQQFSSSQATEKLIGFFSPFMLSVNIDVDQLRLQDYDIVESARVMHILLVQS